MYPGTYRARIVSAGSEQYNSSVSSWHIHQPNRHTGWLPGNVLVAQALGHPALKSFDGKDAKLVVRGLGRLHGHLE
eukprot:scaffold660870_cov43-Prasinocladus_malaysianus.AAC.1